MGIFDGFQFNPQSYGGLLDRIGGGPLAMFGATPESQPSSTVQYGGLQVPVFGQPDQSPIPPNAQPAQYQQQQQMQQQPSGGLGAGFEGFLNNLHTGPIGAVMGGIGSAMGVGSERRNQTVQALISSGVDPELAKTVARDPQLLRAVLPQLMGVGSQTSDIKEYEYAKKQGFTGGLSEWMAQKRVGAGEYGLTPIWGTDAQGNPAYVQPGKSGGAIQGQLPPGFQIARDPIKVEGPTGTSILDPQTRQIIQFIPKDVRGAAAEKKFGEGQGEAQLILPQTKTAVDSAFRAIEGLRNHPGLDIGTGLSSTIDPRSFVPGQPGYDFKALNEQATGKAFMVARESLKGAGQVTDFEGKKGEQAIANLNAAQSKEQYLKALDELERMLRSSYEDLQKKAGMPGAALAKPSGKTSSGLQWSVEK